MHLLTFFSSFLFFCLCQLRHFIHLSHCRARPTVVALLAEGGAYQSSFGESDVQVKTRNSRNSNYWNWIEAL